MWQTLPEKWCTRMLIAPCLMERYAYFSLCTRTTARMYHQHELLMCRDVFDRNIYFSNDFKSKNRAHFSIITCQHVLRYLVSVNASAVDERVK
jgi:hypothetical protein